jgi:hypothetical protein
MSYYEDASLVMIPSGYKNGKVYSQKPTDGAGDLTFTRASNATRVASNGLIEKVRTNLLLQSNTFNTTWTLTSSTTLTSGQAGYDGTNNAWLLKRSDTSARYVAQNITQAASTYTFSVYAKAETVNWIYLYSSDGTNTSTAYFDLANGALGTAAGAITSKIESVGGGWYRCSVSYSDDITSVRIYPAVANNSITGGVSPAGVFIQNSMLETGDIATDYIATTTTAVSVGPVSGLPRLDYLNSSCPRLLLEGQRSNVLTFSERFNDSSWVKTNATVTANAAISPDGYTNADLYDGTNATNAITKVVSAALGTYTLSVFVKRISTNNFRMNFSDGLTGEIRYVFNLTNETSTLTKSGGTISNFTAGFSNYGNGWYRLFITATTNSGTGITSYFEADNQLGSYYLYGAQLELGSYVSSYINTLSTSVTRVADAASKTGISSLIGQTEGTVFVEGEAVTIDTQTNSPVYITVSNGNQTDICYIQQRSNGTIRADYFTGGVQQARISSTTTYPLGTKIKAALGYKSGDFVLYINGVQIGTDVGTSMAPLSKVTIGAFETANFTGSAISQALLFKTRLTNAQLAELTA